MNNSDRWVLYRLDQGIEQTTSALVQLRRQSPNDPKVTVLEKRLALYQASKQQIKERN